MEIQEKPNSPKLENIVIGALLLEKTAIYRVLQVLNEDCFYQKENRLIYTAVMDLYNSKSPIDIITVSERMKSLGTLDKVGGEFGVMDRTMNIGSTANLEFHAASLYDYYLRRKLIDNCQIVSRAAFDKTSDIFELLEKTKREVFGNSAPSTGKVMSLGEITRVMAAAAEKADSKIQRVRGVPTGFQDIDVIFSGLVKSRFYVIGGRPSMGKTTFTLNVAANAANKFKKKGLIFSGEMSGEEITTIIISQQTGIPMEKLNQMAITKENWKQILVEFGGEFGDNLFIDDTATPNILHIQAEAIKYKEKHDIGFIVVDYIQICKVSEKGLSPLLKVSRVSSELKALSKNLGVPVIALSQLSRECEKRVDKRPLLSDLKETGDIEQDADIVAFLYRPDYYGVFHDGKGNTLVNIAEFIIAKNKFGPKETILLYFDKNIGRFSGFDINANRKVPLKEYDMSLTKFVDLGQPYDYTAHLPQGTTSDDLPF